MSSDERFVRTQLQKATILFDEEVGWIIRFPIVDQTYISQLDARETSGLARAARELEDLLDSSWETLQQMSLVKDLLNNRMLLERGFVDGGLS